MKYTLLALLFFAATVFCNSVRVKDTTTNTIYDSKNNFRTLRDRLEKFRIIYEGRNNIPTVTANEAGDIYKSNEMLKLAKEDLLKYSQAPKQQTMTDKQEQKFYEIEQMVNRLNQQAMDSLTQAPSPLEYKKKIDLSIPTVDYNYPKKTVHKNYAKNPAPVANPNDLSKTKNEYAELKQMYKAYKNY